MSRPDLAAARCSLCPLGHPPRVCRSQPPDVYPYLLHPISVLPQFGLTIESMRLLRPACAALDFTTPTTVRKCIRARVANVARGQLARLRYLIPPQLLSQRSYTFREAYVVLACAFPPVVPVPSRQILT